MAVDTGWEQLSEEIFLSVFPHGISFTKLIASTMLKTDHLW